MVSVRFGIRLEPLGTCGPPTWLEDGRHAVSRAIGGRVGYSWMDRALVLELRSRPFSLRGFGPSALERDCRRRRHSTAF